MFLFKQNGPCRVKPAGAVFMPELLDNVM